MKKGLKDILLSLLKVAVVVVIIVALAPFFTSPVDGWELYSSSSKNHWRVKVVQLPEVSTRSYAFLSTPKKSDSYEVQVFQGKGNLPGTVIRLKNHSGLDSADLMIEWEDERTFLLKVDEAPALKGGSKMLGQFWYMEFANSQ